MPQAVAFTQTVVINGSTFGQAVELAADSVEETKPNVPAAKGGSLTTRTNDTTGTLTMLGGHGLATADVIDLYWPGGSRRGVTVGTVAVNSVPISGGSGTNLPDLNVEITAMKPVERSFSVVGDDVKALAAYCPVSGHVVFVDGANAVIVAYQILPSGGTSRTWASGSGVTNPLATKTVAKVRFSHADSTQAREMVATAAF